MKLKSKTKSNLSQNYENKAAMIINWIGKINSSFKCLGLIIKSVFKLFASRAHYIFKNYWLKMAWISKYLILKKQNDEIRFHVSLWNYECA